jgi:hypothetical protein
MLDVSEDMIRAVFTRQVEPLAMLVTIAADGLAEPILVTSDPNGTTSLDREFIYFPFTFTGGGASVEEQTRSVKIEIGNTDGAISEAIRTVTGVPLLTFETVRVSAPDDVEIAIVDAEMIAADVVEPTVTGTLMPRNFANEPAISKRYIAARTPGLPL